MNAEGNSSFFSWTKIINHGGMTQRVTLVLTNHNNGLERRSLPQFEGGDPCGWILKAEKYFRYFEISNKTKVKVAAMHLEGDALDLYAWVTSEREIILWDDLVHVCL